MASNYSIICNNLSYTYCLLFFLYVIKSAFMCNCVALCWTVLIKPNISAHPWVREGGEALEIPIDISVLSNMRQFVKYSRMKQFALRVREINSSLFSLEGMEPVWCPAFFIIDYCWNIWKYLAVSLFYPLELISLFLLYLLGLVTIFLHLSVIKVIATIQVLWTYQTYNVNNYPAGIG